MWTYGTVALALNSVTNSWHCTASTCAVFAAHSIFIRTESSYRLLSTLMKRYKLISGMIGQCKISITAEDSDRAKQGFVGRKKSAEQYFHCFYSFWVSLNCFEHFKVSVISLSIFRFSQLSLHTCCFRLKCTQPFQDGGAVTAKVKAGLEFSNPSKKFKVQQIQSKQIESGCYFQPTKPCLAWSESSVIMLSKMHYILKSS